MSRESKATKEEIQRNRDEAYQNGWGDGYAEGFGKATEAAIAPTDAADAVEAHDEQLGVWADELMADLVLNSLMDLVDHEYDTKVGARRGIIAALKQANQARVPQIAPTDAAQAREATFRDGWGFAYRQWQATGSVPDPDYKPSTEART